jgi:hypothetical protein
MATKKKAAKAKKPIRSLRAKTLTAKQARSVKGGKPQKADGSLDAGIHFKYDLKAQKEG